MDDVSSVESMGEDEGPQNEQQAALLADAESGDHHHVRSDDDSSSSSLDDMLNESSSLGGDDNGVHDETLRQLRLHVPVPASIIMPDPPVRVAAAAAAAAAAAGSAGVVNNDANTSSVPRENSQNSIASANCERLATSLPDHLQENGREVFAAMVPEVVAAAVEELDDLERRQGAMAADGTTEGASAAVAATAKASGKKRKELERVCDICNINRPLSDYNVRLYTPGNGLREPTSECHTKFTDDNTGTVHPVAPNPRPSVDAPRSVMNNRPDRSSFDRQTNTVHECRHCLSGRLTHRKCRSCQSIQPLDMFYCIVSGQTNWWRSCSECRSEPNPISSRDIIYARYRDMRAVTHGYLCPIFTSYVRASSPWTNMETPPDQVPLSTDQVSREGVVGEYTVLFYVGSKIDIGPKVYSRRCGGNVSLTIEEVTDGDGQVTKMLKGKIQLGNGRVRMSKDLERKGPGKQADYDLLVRPNMSMRAAMDKTDRERMAEIRAADFAAATRIDHHSEHYNCYEPDNGALTFLESSSEDIANQAELVALGSDHVKNRGKERAEVPDNALAIKVLPNEKEEDGEDDNSDRRKNYARGRRSYEAFRRLHGRCQSGSEAVDDAQVFPSSEHVHAFITTVATRVAVPRCRDDRYVRAMWHKVPDPLTIEQGDALMERYNNVGRSWMCKRLHLPELAAMNVRKFLKPEPVHIFEPGDLWVRFTYSERGREKGHPALIVARRKN